MKDGVGGCLILMPVLGHSYTVISELPHSKGMSQASRNRALAVKHGINSNEIGNKHFSVCFLALFEAGAHNVACPILKPYPGGLVKQKKFCFQLMYVEPHVYFLQSAALCISSESYF